MKPAPATPALAIAPARQFHGTPLTLAHQASSAVSLLALHPDIPTQSAWLGLTGIPADLADGDDIGAPLVHTHAGGDITSAVPTATTALTADHTPWSGLTGIPAGFADGVDNTAVIVSQTAIYAGAGLSQTSTSHAVTLSVRFAGPGQADLAARSDHDHAGVYAPVIHTHTGGDITSAVPTATLSLSATQAAWAGLTGIPADLADGDDIGAPVVHTHAGGDITSAVPTAALALSTTQAAWSGLTGIPADLADGDDIGAPLAHTHDGGDITSAVQTATLSLSTTQAAWAGLTGVPADLADGDDIGAPLVHTHAGGDITSAVPTATNALTAAAALTADHAPWSGLSGVPAGFADGVDNTAVIVSQTAIYAGAGLSQTSTSHAVTLSVRFAGPGQADSAARSDHDHAGSYAPVAHTHAGNDITGAVPTATLALTATQAPWAGLIGVPADLADGDDVGAPVVHAHAGGDITSAVPTATLALSATAALSATNALTAEHTPWAGLTGVPAGFADGVDNTAVIVSQTAIYAGEGLTQTTTSHAVTLSVRFAGPGQAGSVARSDHDHANTYAPAIHTHAGGDITGAVATATLALTATQAPWAGLIGVPADLADGDNVGAPLTHTHAGSDITTGTIAEAHISPALARDSEIPDLVAAAGYLTRSLANAIYAPLAHQHTGNDITTAVPTATLSLSTTQAAWSGLTGVPADLADGDDIGAPLVHTHAGSDITSAVPTATAALTAAAALTATQSAWAGLTGIPPDLADGDDVGAPVVHTHAGGDITTGLVAEARISQALARDAEIPDLAAAAGYITRTAASAAYAPLAHQHAGGDITSAVPTATLALTATQSPWDGLTGIPPDLADGDDVGAPLVHTHAGSDITTGLVAEARISQALARDAEIPDLAAAAGYITRSLANAAYAPLAHQHAGSDITTAVPTATTALFAGQAVSAAAAPRSGLTGIPPDLADGDDVGVYTAGFGLAVTAGQFSFVVAIQPDGAPVCQPDAPYNRLARPAANALSTLDSAGDVGQYASVTIGADGLPIISYYSDNDGALKVAHCQDAACAAATFSLVDDPAGDTVGYYSSIAIGSDGRPIISYHDATHASLKVAHCQDIACATAVSVTLDASADVGWWTTIAVGADGLPVIAYHDASLGAQGLKVAHCADVMCSAAVSVTLDSGANLGWYASLAVGADGLPIVSYYDFTHTALKVAHCADTACSSAAIATLDDSADVGRFSALTIGADGRPVIAYHDFTNKTLRVAHCHDEACSAAASVLVDGTSANVGQYSAITVGVDGLPLLVYYDAAGPGLRAAHCANPLCVPYFRRR